MFACGIPRSTEALSPIQPDHLHATVWHLDCLEKSMMDVALTLLALIAGGLTFELFTISVMQNQDLNVFHPELTGEELYCGNPS